MNDITMSFKDKKVRIIDNNGNPWFVVTDVCRVLGLSNPTESIRNHSKDDLSTTEVIDSIGRKQKVNIVNEPGVYKLIFQSRKAEAEAFKKWVTHEVLPSIRKTGTYSIPQALKKKSTRTRNLLTDEWQSHGVTNPKEFAYLTLEEYKQLQFEKGKRKKDFDDGELKTLMALEAMEMLSLHYNPVEGYIECKENLGHTAKKVLEVKTRKGIHD